MPATRRSLLGALAAGPLLIRSARADDDVPPPFDPRYFGKLTQTRPVASLTIETAEGQIMPLSYWQGRPLVLHFWATWCPPCVAEFPEVAKVIGQLGKNDPIVLPIAVRGDTAKPVRAFFARKSIDTPFYIDPLSRTMMETADDDALRAAAKAEYDGKYPFPPGDITSLHAIPRTLIVNAQSNLVAEVCGGLTWSVDGVRKTIMALASA